jgi:hypothetical protein
MKHIEWQTGEHLSQQLIVGKIMVENRIGHGSYTIECIARPSYCDRGDWIINVIPSGSAKLELDQQDGFPRYFFGSEDEVKEQMQRWANKRKETV